MKTAASEHSSVHADGTGISIPGRILTVREAAAFLRLSKSFLDKRRMDGAGPIYLKMGRRIGYSIKDLETWADTTRRRHTGAQVQATNLVQVVNK